MLGWSGGRGEEERFLACKNFFLAAGGGGGGHAIACARMFVDYSQKSMTRSGGQKSTSLVIGLEIPYYGN